MEVAADVPPPEVTARDEDEPSDTPLAPPLDTSPPDDEEPVSPGAGHCTACMQPSTPTPPAPAEKCALVPTPASRLPRGNRAGG